MGCSCLSHIEGAIEMAAGVASFDCATAGTGADWTEHRVQHAT
jgi:hypothetical protein